MEIHVAAQSVLNQLHSVVEQLDDATFATPSAMLSGASPGQHVRHVIEFFGCCSEGCRNGIVNYDKRAHDRTVETDRSLALRRLVEQYDSFETWAGDEPVLLETCMDSAREKWIRIPSSAARELAYAIDHAIHHMAILKIAIRALQPSVRIDGDFGVAFSTVRHRSVAGLTT